jgi:hypothetical protein
MVMGFRFLIFLTRTHTPEPLKRKIFSWCTITCNYELYQEVTYGTGNTKNKYEGL